MKNQIKAPLSVRRAEQEKLTASKNDLHPKFSRPKKKFTKRCIYRTVEYVAKKKLITFYINKNSSQMNFTLSCHAAYEYKQGRDFYENEKRLFLVLTLVLTLLTSAVALGEGQPQPKVPKYVFAFIGDGGYLSVMMIYIA